MKIERDLDLRKYSTMHLQSVGDVMFFPESEDELITLINDLNGNYQLLSGGSNTIFAEHVYKPIINLMNVNSSMSLSEGVFSCGCSVRIQSFIRYAMDKGYGGIEFLYSLPASMGGIVYMNAGRGGGDRQSISDYLLEVTIYDCDRKEVRTVDVDKSLFAHHVSPFQTMNCIILSCKLKLEQQTQDVTESLIKARLEHCKIIQDSSFPNCGSAFSKGNRVIFKLFQLLGVRSGDAMFSRKTSDWISNTGNATATDVKKLLNRMKRAHKLVGAKCVVEYKFFD